jgi:hypothetical protein
VVQLYRCVSNPFISTYYVGMTISVNKRQQFLLRCVNAPLPQFPQSRRRVFYFFVDVKTPHISVFVPSYPVNGRLHRHKENLTKYLMQHNTSTDSTKEQPESHRLQQHHIGQQLSSYKPIIKMKLIFNLNGNATWKKIML